MKLGTASVIRANSRHLPLADDSVDLIVTSPPYFALRSYQDGGEHYAGQIGDEPTPAEFVESLLEVTAECVRVLKPSGSLWVNLGDKYAGSQPGSYRRDTQPFATQLGDRSHRLTAEGERGSPDVEWGGVRQKSLMGIPWRYALRCIDDLGLILRAEVIWSKPNGLPESVTDRVRRSHEQWFHFTLEPRYFSAVDEIREAHTQSRKPDGATIGGKRVGNTPRTSLGNTYDEQHPLGKLPGSVWTVPTEPLRVPDHLGVDHFAAFPTEWPRRIIQGWSPSGVCVACDAPLVPVVAKEGGRPVARAHRHLPGYSDPAGEGMRDQSYRIEGYSCSCPPKSPTSTVSARTTAETTPTTTAPLAAAAGGSRPHIRDATVPTRPAVVLDPFGGTGTTAMVAKALGRHGISVDMSADYCRLAEWRTNDRDQLAKVLGIAKADPVAADEQSLLDLINEEAS